MSAREKIIRFVEHNEPDLGKSTATDPDTGGWVMDVGAHIGLLLDAHAHELAEQQRRQVPKQCVNDSDGDGDCAACARNPESLCRQPTSEGWAVMRAADLIDPQASAGPVRPDEEPT